MMKKKTVLLYILSISVAFLSVQVETNAKEMDLVTQSVNTSGNGVYNYEYTDDGLLSSVIYDTSGGNFDRFFSKIIYFYKGKHVVGYGVQPWENENGIVQKQDPNQDYSVRYDLIGSGKNKKTYKIRKYSSYISIDSSSHYETSFKFQRNKNGNVSKLWAYEGNRFLLHEFEYLKGRMVAETTHYPIGVIMDHNEDSVDSLRYFFDKNGNINKTKNRSNFWVFSLNMPEEVIKGLAKEWGKTFDEEGYIESNNKRVLKYDKKERLIQRKDEGYSAPVKYSYSSKSIKKEYEDEVRKQQWVILNKLDFGANEYNSHEFIVN